jgi:hypothetical protein
MPLGEPPRKHCLTKLWFVSIRRQTSASLLFSTTPTEAEVLQRWQLGQQKLDRCIQLHSVMASSDSPISRARRLSGSHSSA